MKIKEFLNIKINFLLVIILFLLTGFTFLYNLYCDFRIKEVSYGKINIYESNESIGILDESNSFSYLGKVKSAFIDDKYIYILYYYPFDVLFKKGDNLAFEFSLSNLLDSKNKINYDEYPFYLIIDKENSKIIQLNSKKHIIKGDKIDFDISKLKQLDNSKLVSIGKINFKTDFLIDTITNTNLKILIKKFIQIYNKNM